MTSTEAVIGERPKSSAPRHNAGLRDRLPEEPADRRAAVELELQRLVFVRQEEPQARSARRRRQRRVRAVHATPYPADRLPAAAH